MALSLLDTCTRALDEISSIAVPTFIVGNTDPIAVQLLALARKVGEEQVRDYDWNELHRTATVTTSNGDNLYPVESDFDRMASDTMWDATQFRQMDGHTSRRQWAAITNSQVDPGITYRWRLFGGQIQVEPTPTVAFDFTYEYNSKAYCTDSLGVERVDGWVADTDLPILQADIFINGIRYYFTKAKGLPFSDAAAEYDAVVLSRQNKNKPRQMIDMHARVPQPRLTGRYINLPDRVDYT